MSAVATELAAGTWTVDPTSTRTQFQVRDVLHRTVVGTLSLRSATVEVSADGVPLQVRADLDLRSVATGNARRDADLRGPRFFDVERNAVLQLSAGPARPDGPARWLLAGELGLKDSSCPLDVAVQLVDLADGRARVRATATLDRRAAGITVPALLVGRHVAVQVDAVLHAPADRSAARSAPVR